MLGLAINIQKTWLRSSKNYFEQFYGPTLRIYMFDLSFVKDRIRYVSKQIPNHSAGLRKLLK
jgi:hypothetical protein